MRGWDWTEKNRCGVRRQTQKLGSDGDSRRNVAGLNILITFILLII
jgi:hypothetical protein